MCGCILVAALPRHGQHKRQVSRTLASVVLVAVVGTILMMWWVYGVHFSHMFGGETPQARGIVREVSTLAEDVTEAAHLIASMNAELRASMLDGLVVRGCGQAELASACSASVAHSWEPIGRAVRHFLPQATTEVVVQTRANFHDIAPSMAQLEASFGAGETQQCCIDPMQ